MSQLASKHIQHREEADPILTGFSLKEEKSQRHLQGLRIQLTSQE